MNTLRTGRLVLRPWREEDLVPFAALNADPRVATYLPSTLTQEESDAVAQRIRDHFAEHGYGWWAVELADVAPFVGTVGLSIPNIEAHFAPCVQVAWRLAADHWGKGYATEAAEAALRYAFNELRLDEVVSFTVPHNLPSRRVMEKIGMVRNPEEDFDHPKLPEGHPLRRHVLYRIKRERGALLDGIARGQAAIVEGRTFSHREVKARLSRGLPDAVPPES